MSLFPRPGLPPVPTPQSRWLHVILHCAGRRAWATYPPCSVLPASRLLSHPFPSKFILKKAVPGVLSGASRAAQPLLRDPSTQRGPRPEGRVRTASLLLCPADNTDLDLEGESPEESLPWEKELASRVRDMLVWERNDVLEGICHHLQGQSQTFLFQLYGLILGKCTDARLVRKHLAILLELSHQSSSQREGISIAVGWTSASHLEEVWEVLEHLGRTRFLRSALTSPDGQDNVLKMSFLSSAIMLTKALGREHSAQSYKFTQIPELIQCLLCILQKEPNFLATFSRQKIILVIWSGPRPGWFPGHLVRDRGGYWPGSSAELGPVRLATAVASSLCQVLYRKTMHTLNVLLQNFISENKSMDEIYFLLQHTEPWLSSEKIHERKRAVESIFLLLKFVVESLKFTEEAAPSMLGHQIGLLLLLCRDKDEDTRNHSQQCIYFLLQLLVQQKGEWGIKQLEGITSKEWEAKLHDLMKAFEENLTVAQHTQLVLTLLHSLQDHDRLRCDLASQLLLLAFQDPGIKLEQVAEILQGLFQELPGIIFENIQETMMKATAALGAQHSQETVDVVLSLCHPSERLTLPLWKALAANGELAREVITLLYTKMKLRPPEQLIRPTQQAQLISLLALGTMYELLYTQEYKPAVQWAFAGILLVLLTQLHYLLELGMVEGISDYQDDVLDSKPLGPGRICLEALKGLFWTTDNWEVFAHLKLLKGWELFEHLETYTEGVTLLARAIAHYDCELKAVLGQASISLKSAEERDNIVAILFITEFLNSPNVSHFASRRTMNNFLSLGLKNPNQLVQALSLKGFSSTLMQPEKEVLLQNRLLELLGSFLKPQPEDPVGLMQVLGDILHHLSVQGIGALSLKIAQHLLALFEDERAEVRGGAIFLFGDVMYSGGKKFQQPLETVVFQALVPLLFHLADPCPEVITKTKFTFLRCAILLKWEFQKELFGKLAWGHGLSAENDIFIFTVESNFGKYHRLLMQALTYLDSPYNSLKLAAVKFIGLALVGYGLTVRPVVSAVGFEALQHDLDPRCRKFYLNFLDDIIELSQNVA
uniref:Maestro heat-like repeat family member 5 n=1 Tax=Prolemur simus TaxID=1328070 RepID=A0A8C9ACY4_PROSS